MNLLRRHFFLVGIGLAALIATIFPPVTGWGRDVLTWTTKVGIGGIFLIYGWKMELDHLGERLRDWRLHLSIQATTFLVLPFVGWMLYLALSDSALQAIREPIFYTMVLPSTVSFSVMMTAIARGNLAASILNASLSGIIGVMVIPLWLQFVGIPFVQDASLGFIYSMLIIQILVPVGLGLMSQRRVLKRISRNHFILKHFDKFIIWLIVYKSFSASYSTELSHQLGVMEVAVVGGTSVLLYFLALGITGRWARFLGFSRDNTISFRLCGTLKSLVHGTAMAAVFFAPEQIPTMLLGILFYHGFALFYTSYLAEKWGRTPESTQS